MNYQQNISNSLSGASLLMLIVLALITAAVTVFGCAWSGTSHSVRFNDYQTEREMGRLPPLPKPPANRPPRPSARRGSRRSCRR